MREGKFGNEFYSDTEPEFIVTNREILQNQTKNPLKATLLQQDHFKTLEIQKLRYGKSTSINLANFDIND